MLTLEEKVVIVTGAASGIGLATATLCLELGASVFAVDISPRSAALPAENSQTFVFHQVNLAKPNAAAEVVAACVEKLGGRIDVLLNIAGVMDQNNSVDTLDPAMWDRVIAINLTAPVMLMKAVTPYMVAQKSGSIVNVASRAGMSGAVAGVAYTSSKHGIIGATKNVAWRFHNEGVRCNAICPGGVATNIIDSVDATKFDQGAMKVVGPIHAVHTHPDGKGYCLPSEQAKVLVFLASDMSKEINGAIIPVDNAWSTI